MLYSVSNISAFNQTDLLGLGLSTAIQLMKNVLIIGCQNI